jgi:hypothetical protein
MSLPSSPVDPGIARLLDAIGNGATASDSTAALLLRLVNRVAILERTARDHDLKIQKLALQPRPSGVHEEKMLEQNAPGVEGRNGGAVGPERDSAPARPAPHAGRPKGRPDSQSRYIPRQRTGGIWPHKEDHEIEVAHIVDRDWDAG